MLHHTTSVYGIADSVLTVQTSFAEPKSEYYDRLNESLVDIQSKADEVRREHEREVQQRCDALIKQYRAIAEQATAQAAAFRQEQQLASIEEMKINEESRVDFEKKILARAKRLVFSANQKLEKEREKFVKYETEIRRQFEAHCLDFEHRIRAKAVDLLSSNGVNETIARHAAAAFDKIQSDHREPVRLNIRNDVHQERSSSSPRTSSSQVDALTNIRYQEATVSHPRDLEKDARIKRTVDELKKYMASLSSSNSFLNLPGPSLSGRDQQPHLQKTPPLREPPAVPSVSKNASRLRSLVSPPQHEQLTSEPWRAHSSLNQYSDSQELEDTTDKTSSVTITGASVLGARAAYLVHSDRSATAQTHLHQGNAQTMSRFVESIVDNSAREDTKRLMEGLNSLY